MKPFIYIILVLTLFSCRKETNELAIVYPELMAIPEGFPPINFPENNEFSLERWELGKRLFYDPILSADNSTSCASCHLAELAFSDNVMISPGVEGRLGMRNSPSLTNIAYHPYFTREGGVPTIEMQVLVPIQEHVELDFNVVLIAERMMEDSSYVEMAWKAYEREPDAFVITRAIANFERSFISGNSDYDRYENHADNSAMTSSEIRGMELFNSTKTNCSSCHGGFNFTNYSFENNGLYEVYEDEGRYRVTGLESDRALFKVPSLRNIELTAPYMHDGSINTLEEVVEHYVSGGENHLNKNPIIEPIDLSIQEKNDLINFLKTLTDDSFVSNPNFKK